MIFIPFCQLDDISIHGSDHQKFLESFPQKIVPPHIDTFLSNIQMFFNSMHLPSKNDPLSDKTASYSDSSQQVLSPISEDSTEACFVDGMFNILNPLESDLQDQESSSLNISLTNLRKAGARRCGFKNLPIMNSTSEDLSSSISFFLLLYSYQLPN